MPFVACSVQVVCLVVFVAIFTLAFPPSTSPSSRTRSQEYNTTSPPTSASVSPVIVHTIAPQFFVPSYTTLPSLSIISSGLTLASISSASQPVHLSLQTSLVTVQSRQASAVGDSLAPYSCTSNSFAASCRSSTHSTDFSVASSVYR